MMKCLHFIINGFLEIGVIMSQEKVSESLHLENSSLVKTPTGQTAITQLLPCSQSQKKYFFTVFFCFNNVECSFYGPVNRSKESYGANIYSRQWKAAFFFVLD